MSIESQNHRGLQYRVTGRAAGMALWSRKSTEVAARRPDRGAEVSKGHSRCGNEPGVSTTRRPHPSKARTVGSGQ